MEVYDEDVPNQLSREDKTENNLPVEKSMPTPNNPPWNIWVGLGVWVASVLFIIVFQLLFLFIYLIQQRVSFADNNAASDFFKTDSIVILLSVFSTLPAHICTLLLSWLVATNFRKYSFRQTLGWEWGGFKVWHIFVVIISFFLLSWGLISIFGKHENELTRILKSSREAVFVIAFMAIFTAPIVEEVVYRGIIYSAFQKRFGVLAGIIVATFLFAGVHYFQYWGDIAALILITLLSLVLTLIRVKTSNLLPCIILHTVFNAIQALIIIFEPYIENQIKTEQTAFFFHFIK